MVVSKRGKYAAIAAAAAVTATGLGAVVPKGAFSDPLSIIRHYAPGARAAGAVTNKVRKPVVRREARAAPVRVRPHYVRPAKVAAYRPKPVSAVLPTAVQAPAAVGVSSLPVAAAGVPLPAAYVPVLAGGGSVIGPGIGGVLAVPALLAIGGGGHGGGGGGGGTAPFAPAAPEPATWLMLMIGFGYLGMMLRRQRRLNRTGISSRRSRSFVGGTLPA